MTAEDKKISSIYQQANSVEPPAHLDDKILAASRQAVTRPEKDKHRAKGPFSGGWPVPVSIAAVVIVAVIVVPVVMQESTLEKSMPGAETDRRAEKSAADNEMAQRGKLKQQRFNSPAKPQAAPNRLMQTSPIYNQPMENKIMDDKALEELVEPETPAVAAPAFSIYEVDSPGRGTRAKRTSKQDEVSQTMHEEKAVIAQGLMKKERERRVRSPEAWLAIIEELLAANEIEKARLEIQTFRQAYPDYNIGPELNDLLE